MVIKFATLICIEYLHAENRGLRKYNILVYAIAKRAKFHPAVQFLRRANGVCDH